VVHLFPRLRLCRSPVELHWTLPLNLAYALALRAKKSPAIANSGLVVPGL
jgi:hypothetical protein